MHGLRPAKTFELPPLRGPESPSRVAERQTRAAAAAEPERGGGEKSKFFQDEAAGEDSIVSTNWLRFEHSRL